MTVVDDIRGGATLQGLPTADISLTTTELKRLLDLVRDAATGDLQDELPCFGKGIRTLERALACYRRQVQSLQDQMREL